MAPTPQSIRAQQFKTSRKGYDTAEVDEFRRDVADALETAQNEATAMEARARAAVARLQELSRAQTDGGSGTGHEPAHVEAAAPETEAPERVTRAVTPTVDEAETITRTLLLAQRTADTTMAEARVEADRLLNDARERATAADEAARVEREELLEAARIEARRTGEAERVQVEGEVQALLARRDFLVSDVDHLEQFIAAQRERLIEASAEISAIVQRVPNGLADMRRPLLSAAADDDAPAAESTVSDLAELGSTDADETGDIWSRRSDGSDGEG